MDPRLVLPEAAAPDGTGPGGRVPPAETLLSLVYAIARTIGRTLPPVVELDDLIHDGVVGLLESRRRFDAARGVDFRSYAAHRIRGAILDGLRARDPLPRSLRRMVKAAERSEGAVSGWDGRAGPRREPVVPQILSLEEVGPVPEAGREPEARLLAEELAAEVRRAVAALPGRDQRIVALRFAHGWRLREVAAYYGISITRVAEVQDRALRRLRVALDVPRAQDLSPNGRRRRSRRR